MRLRSGFFPFTEPSVEVDVACPFCAAGLRRLQGHRAGSRSSAPAWSTRTCSAGQGYDPTGLAGFAFGLGIERIAMLQPRRRRHPRVLTTTTCGSWSSSPREGPRLLAAGATSTCAPAAGGARRAPRACPGSSSRASSAAARPTRATTTALPLRARRRVGQAPERRPAAPVPGRRGGGRAAPDRLRRRRTSTRATWSSSRCPGAPARRRRAAAARQAARRGVGRDDAVRARAAALRGARRASSCCRRGPRSAPTCRDSVALERGRARPQGGDQPRRLPVASTAWRARSRRCSAPTWRRCPASRARRRPARGRVEDVVRVAHRRPRPLLPRSPPARSTDVRIGASPLWLRQRLAAAGVRPISNVVDVTNYVTLGIGQPMHAYDGARIPGGVLTARRARPGERVVTLDGRERTLDARHAGDRRRRRRRRASRASWAAGTPRSRPTPRRSCWRPRTSSAAASRAAPGARPAHRRRAPLRPRRRRRARAGRLARGPPSCWSTWPTRGQMLPDDLDVVAHVPERERIVLRDAFAEQILGIAVAADEEARHPDAPRLRAAARRRTARRRRDRAVLAR